MKVHDICFREFKPGKRSYASRRRQDEWEHHRQLIEALHADNVTRSKIRETLSHQGFEVSTSQLVRKMMRWKLVTRDAVTEVAVVTTNLGDDDCFTTSSGDTLVEVTQETSVSEGVYQSLDSEQLENNLSMHSSEGMTGMLTRFNGKLSPFTPRSLLTRQPSRLCSYPIHQNASRTEFRYWSNLSTRRQVMRDTNADDLPKPSRRSKLNLHCRCSEFFKLRSTKLTDLLQSVTSLEEMVQKTCNRSNTIQHFLALIILCQVLDASSHLFGVLKSALKTIGRPQWMENGIRQLLAKHLAQLYVRFLAVLKTDHRKSSLDRQPTGPNIRQDWITGETTYSLSAEKVYEAQKPKANAADEIILGLHPFELPDAQHFPFEIAKETLLSNIEAIHKKIAFVGKHDNQKNCVSQIISHVLCTNLAKLSPCEFMNRGLKCWSLAQTCLFFRAASYALTDELLSECPNPMSFNTDIKVVLQHVIHTYFLNIPLVMLNCLHPVLRRCDPQEAIFANIHAISKKGAMQSWWEWLHLSLDDLDKGEVGVHLRGQMSWLRLPTEKVIPDLFVEQKAAKDRSDDNKSVMSSSSSDSFGSFRALAHRLKRGSTSISTRSKGSKWSGHMSLDSWRLGSALNLQQQDSIPEDQVYVQAQ